MFPLTQVHQVFCDAFLVGERRNLLFCSLWGRDTSIQQLRAMLTLPTREGGIDQLEVDRPSARVCAMVDAPERLKSLSGRQMTAQFGELVHYWLYDPLLEKPDQANRKAVWVQPKVDDDPTQPIETHLEVLWPLVKQLVHLPLDDRWMQHLISTFVEQGWIQPFNQHQALGLTAINLDFSGEDTKTQLKQTVIERLKAGMIT